MCSVTFIALFSCTAYAHVKEPVAEQAPNANNLRASRAVGVRVPTDLDRTMVLKCFDKERGNQRSPFFERGSKNTEIIKIGPISIHRYVSRYGTRLLPYFIKLRRARRKHQAIDEVESDLSPHEQLKNLLYHRPGWKEQGGVEDADQQWKVADYWMEKAIAWSVLAAEFKDAVKEEGSHWAQVIPDWKEEVNGESEATAAAARTAADTSKEELAPHWTTAAIGWEVGEINLQAVTQERTIAALRAMATASEATASAAKVTAEAGSAAEPKGVLIGWAAAADEWVETAKALRVAEQMADFEEWAWSHPAAADEPSIDEHGSGDDLIP